MIKLVGKNSGRPLYVDPQRIEVIYPEASTGITIVVVRNGTYLVEETSEEVRKLVESHGVTDFPV